MVYSKKYLVFLLAIMLILLTTVPIFADIIFNDGNYIFDPGEECYDWLLRDMLIVDGDWQAIDNNTGEIIGITTAFAEINDGRPSNWRNYIYVSPIKHWVEDLGGNWDWFTGHKVPERLVEDSDGNSRYEFYIRDVIHKCGGYIPDYDADKNEFYVVRTEGPEGGIYPTSWSVKAGEETTIKINPSSNVPSFTYPGTDWKFYVDGSLVDSGHESKNTAWIKIDYTFPEAKTYNLKLHVTDGVGREHEAVLAFPVGVGENPPEPPPSGSSSGPTAYFTIASYLTAGDTVQPDNQSTAGEGNYLAAYDWEVSPSSGTDISSSWAMEPEITFDEPGSYDVTLTVWDNEDNSDSMTRTVFVEEEGPPQPPPPPPNSPPTARIGMPSYAKQGDTVKVVNRSYDDGEIVDVSWDISPSYGADANLGFDGGTIIFTEEGTYTVTLEVTDDQGASDTDEDFIKIKNKPPVAKIDVPEEVMQGEDVDIESDSYDPDGSIVSYNWSITPSDTVIGTIEGEESTVYFDKEREYTITLTVEDDWGKTDTAAKTITVKPAVPEAYFFWTGDAKQNRKIVLDAAGSYSSERYPIIWEEAQWEFIPPAEVSQDAVKVRSSNDLSKREVLFKEAGTYKLRLQLKNTAGHISEWYEETIDIKPDEPPRADFKVITKVLRDPDNSNLARIDITDKSVSYDGDDISKRVWKYRYDSDNDDSFTDESWIIIDENNNLLNPTLYVTDVGKYQFELEIEESFGQPTLPEFISSEDIRTGDTYSKSLEEKTVEVLNIAPITNFEAIKKKKVDIVFTVGKTDSEKVDNLDALVNEIMKSKLNSFNIEYGKISTVESYHMSTEESDASQIFSNWRSVEIPYDFDGSFSDVSGGWEIEGNKIYADSGYRPARAWINPSSRAYGSGDATIEFTWGIRNDANDFMHGESGFLFRIKDEQNYYAYIMDNHDACGNVRYDGREVLVKVENGSRKIISTNDFPRYYAGQSEDIKIILEGSNIKVYRNGNLIFNYTDNSNPHLNGSYGFYVWDQYGAYFSNISIETINIKTLDEVLKEPSWREDTEKFLINISDEEYPEFNDLEKKAVIMSRLINQGIHFGVLGTYSNSHQAEDIINENNNKGFFAYNYNMDEAINEATDYIINITNETHGNKVQYVLLNEELAYNTFYSDTENDPEIERRWKYEHDPYYFDNSMGRAGFHNQFITGPIYSFDKVGKYDVVFQAKDNPKDDERFSNYRKWSDFPAEHLTLYVHRKPLALYEMDLTPDVVSVKEDFEDTVYFFNFSGDWIRNSEMKYSGSYSYKNKNISHNSTSSTQFTFTTPANNGKISFWHLVRSEKKYDWFKIYIDDVCVVDRSGYGSWEYYEQQLEPGEHNVRMKYRKDGSKSSYDDAAYIDDIKVTYTKKYNITLTSQAYDPDHETEINKGIVEEEWKWKEAAADRWNYGKPSILDVNKTYLISYRVKDVEGVWSDYNVKAVSTGSNVAPVAQFTVSPNPLPLGLTLSYEDFSYDPNGDNLVQYQWRYEDPQGTWHNTGSSFPGNIYNQLGEYRIELTVQDEYGEWSEPFYQVVSVIPANTKPVADFKVLPNPLPQDVEVNYIDNSFDPDGDPIVAREWQYRKNGGNWVNGQPTDFAVLGTGIYEIRLRVLDQPALAQMTPRWSDWHTETLQVVSGNQKPVAQFSILPNPAIADEPVTYINNSYDPDGAGITESVWQVRDENNNILGEYHNKLPPEIFEATGWGDNGAGTYIIALKVKDVSPNGISPALWSDWCEKTLVVEDPLYVEGKTNKNIYAAGEAMILSADTEGRAFKVEAKMWWDAGANGFSETNRTELIPDYPIGDTPPDINHWETKHDILAGDYDEVVIIPYDMPDGIYTVEFTAYKKRHDGSFRIKTDKKSVRVSGSQLNKLKTRLRNY